MSPSHGPAAAGPASLDAVVGVVGRAETDNAEGRPERARRRLHGALAEWFDARGLQAHVSVTDETDYAASFVVVETRSER